MILRKKRCFCAAPPDSFLAGFSLQELTIVLIIIGILAVITIPVFKGVKVNSMDREAEDMLLLIGQAEEMYRLTTMRRDLYGIVESGHYGDCATTAQCNQLLDLSLHTGAARGWDYSITIYNANVDYCIQATSTAANPPARTFSFRNTDTQPSSAACP